MIVFPPPVGVTEPDKPLELLVLMDSAFPWISGGRETGMYNLSKQLRGRIHFTFVTHYMPSRLRANRGFADLHEWARIVPVWIFSRRTWPIPRSRSTVNIFWFARRARSVGRRLGPFDAILTLNGGVVADSAQELSRLWNAPVIINYRSHWTEEVTNQPLLHPFFKRLERLEVGNLRRADILLANGHDTAAHLAEITGDASRVVALCNGVNTELFHPREPGASRPWPPEKVVFISNSTLRDLKGLDVPMQCVGEMSADQRQHVHLVYAGRGDWRPYEALARELSITEQVEYLGELPHEELAPALREADVGLFPGVHGAGMSHAALECLASGLPLVAHDYADFPSLVDKGRTGHLVALGDKARFKEAMVYIIGNRSRLPAMSRCAREKALEYSWPRIADRFHDALCRAVQTRDRG